MLLTARHVKKMFDDIFSLNKFPVLREIKNAVALANHGKRRCQSCKLPEIIREKLYNNLVNSQELLNYTKQFFKTKSIEMYFAKSGSKRKEIYRL